MTSPKKRSSTSTILYRFENLSYISENKIIKIRKKKKGGKEKRTRKQNLGYGRHSDKIKLHPGL